MLYLIGGFFSLLLVLSLNFEFFWLVMLWGRRQNVKNLCIEHWYGCNAKLQRHIFKAIFCFESFQLSRHIPVFTLGCCVRPGSTRRPSELKVFTKAMQQTVIEIFDFLVLKICLLCTFAFKSPLSFTTPFVSDKFLLLKLYGIGQGVVFIDAQCLLSLSMLL